MAQCDYCGATILFGGVKEGELRFCNNDCYQKGAYLILSNALPQEEVHRFIQEVHMGNCPKCNGPGPVDVHTSYFVWSLVFLTSWSSKPQLCCRSCGAKSQVLYAFLSLLLGWWGIPWGVIMTPVQILRNLSALANPPDTSVPSPQMEKLLRVHLASQIAQQVEQDEQSSGQTER